MARSNKVDPAYLSLVNLARQAKGFGSIGSFHSYWEKRKYGISSRDTVCKYFRGDNIDHDNFVGSPVLMVISKAY